MDSIVKSHLGMSGNIWEWLRIGCYKAKLLPFRYLCLLIILIIKRSLFPMHLWKIVTATKDLITTIPAVLIGDLEPGLSQVLRNHSNKCDCV